MQKERKLYSTLTLNEIFVKLSEAPEKGLYDYFFNKYYQKLIWFALLYVKNHNAAEEVVSDVLLSIFKKRRKIAKYDNIEGYIFISVKNQSLKYLRKNKRLVFSENFESEADLLMTTSVSPEYEALENEFYGIIKSTLDSLPPKRRLVFRMIKEEGLKYNDVAKLLDLSVKTVETHMGLALKTLHENISKYERGEFVGITMYPAKS
ncbi:MAG: RNA polymerase sigma-70 factor [Cytophagales bacterium]|nr:RNA polymerase sigma-70 factor [Cytophagales bacterium]